LELEITESVLLEETEEIRDTLTRLKGLGVKISMDDFGTGYSSLSCLRSFPFDKIKIDQSFIRTMATAPETATIVRS
ncbi:EAL domain-containing protein, partial [Mycobacterium tuberculosis]|nr:EAL domain-containing protein [Mycobacterium tuberculosis]